MHVRSILKNTLRALLFAAAAAALCAAARFLLVDDVHAYSRIMLNELYAAAGSIDTVFVGSSHCYRSFDPALVDERLGTHSFNAGTSQQLPDGSYWLLREITDENDLDTVYLEMFFTGYNQQASADVPMATFLITDYMRASSPNRYRYLWEMGGLAALPDLILPARHAIADPGALPELWRAKLTDGYAAGSYKYVTYPGEGYRGRGFVWVDGTPQYGYYPIFSVDPAAPLSDFGRQNLTRITQLCKEKGIRLVLVTAPLPNAFAAITPNYQAYVDALREFAAQNGLEYWDFTLFKDTQALPLGHEHFADTHHLNGTGAELFTAAFCQVAAQSAAGQDVLPLFFDTLEEKLTLAPDGTMAAPGGQG